MIYFFRTCIQPDCDWVDYSWKSIAPGKKIGTIPRSGDSRDTFRKIFIISLVSYERVITFEFSVYLEKL